jgi:phosphopantothenoylcysteine synthetase/decarboxylase
MNSKVMYIIACAAPPTRDIAKFVKMTQRAGWDTCLVVTPSAIRFFSVPELCELTGHTVRSDYKAPGDPDVLPDPDAIIVAPATVNTINKWAAGICDTLALGLLVEAIGKKLPVTALPFTNYAQAAHPAFEDNIEKLRSWGVRVLYGPDVYRLHAPGTGGQYVGIFPWHLALEATAFRLTD